jgi:hypothetical protein
MRFCELRSLARQPDSGLFGCLEQGSITDTASAEPRFKVPMPFSLQVWHSPSRRTITAARSPYAAEPMTRADST